MFSRRKKQKRENAINTSRRSPDLSHQKANKSVFSYHSKRAQSEIQRPRNDVFDQKIKKRNKNLAYAPTILAIILLLLSFGYMSILDTTPQVMPLVHHDNGLLRDTPFYRKTISSILDDSLSNRLKLTIDTNKIEQDILKELPELDQVSINIPLIGRRPVVQISATDPSLIVTTDDSYVVGVNGKILMKLADLPENQRSGLTKVNDAIGLDAEVGDTILPIDTITFINDVLFQFKQNNMEIDSIELPAVANELHVRPKGEAYIIRYDLQGDAREQSGRYFIILDTLTKGAIPVPREYIDVRVEGRAYYK